MKYQIRNLIQKKKTDYINKLSRANELAKQEYEALAKLFNITAISKLEQAEDVPFDIKNQSDVSQRIKMLAEFVKNG